MSKKIKISIIIPVYNQIEFTKNCINYVEKNTERVEYNSYEVIVVDNNSSDSTESTLKELVNQYEHIRYFRLDKNYGFSYACNYGAKYAEGEFLVFLNNDTEPQKDWLKNGIGRLEKDKSIGIVGAKLLYPDRKVQHCGIEFFQNVNPDYTYWPLHRYLNADENIEEVNKPEEVVGVTGACMFIPKKIFDQVGWFDESYNMYFEDLDLCFKVRKLGLKIFYEPTSVLIHYEGKSSKNQTHIDGLNYNSAKIFFSKWNSEVKKYILSKFFDFHDEKFTILNKSIYPKSLIQNTDLYNPEISKIEYLNFIDLINTIGSAYVHFGGAGDALLLLSTFYDDNPNQVIISFANSVNAMKSFFSAFPLLKHVYFIPLPPNYILHSSLRKILPKLNNINGMGATPTKDYENEWNKNLDIFKEYGINNKPGWIKNFRIGKEFKYQVTIAPKGSLFGMVGSKKNILSYSDWVNTLKFFNNRGIKLIILGTPEENKDYPDITGINSDRRSYSFKEQMELIAGSDIFIGADSWGKTFAALAGIKTFVFKPITGNDLKDWTDPSEFVFIKPWPEITVVKNFNELKKHLLKIPLLNRDFTIAIDGPLMSMNSLTVVNSQLALQLIRRAYRVSLISDLMIDNTFFSDPNHKILKSYLNKFKKNDITISHYFPPKNQKPNSSKWVVIQPWEFGSIPKDWVNIFNNLVDEVWVPSNFVKNIFTNDGIDNNKIKIIPNGINPEVFKKSDIKYPLKTKKRVKFLFVGGTIYRKGIDILLKAYTSAFNADDDVCLIIKDVASKTVYKDSNYLNQIKQIKSLANVPEIEYIDINLTSGELAALYNTCDFLIHPYRGEGFGLPVLEAMACGLIPIVTRGGATEDFCDDSNSIKINSHIKYLESNYIGNYLTVNKPWLLEPDLADTIRILKEVYNNAENIKLKMSDVSRKVINNWSWENSFYLMQIRIHSLISNSEISIAQANNSEKNDLTELNLDILINEIKTAIKNNEIAKSIELLESFYKTDFNKINNHQKVLLLDIIGNLYLSSNNIEKAQYYFEQELQISTNSSNACLGLGKVLFAKNQPDAAKTMFEWALKNDPENLQAKNLLEELNLKLGYDIYHNSLLEREIASN